MSLLLSSLLMDCCHSLRLCFVRTGFFNVLYFSRALMWRGNLARPAWSTDLLFAAPPSPHWKHLREKKQSRPKDRDGICTVINIYKTHETTYIHTPPLTLSQKSLPKKKNPARLTFHISVVFTHLSSITIPWLCVYVCILCEVSQVFFK